jgi:GNAT superfamily N-acetyltransferase
VTEDALAVRQAREADIDGVVATVTSAFIDDPLWAPLFADASARAIQSAVLWRAFVSSAVINYPWTFFSADFGAVSVWLPPGATELTEDDERRLDEALETSIGRAGVELFHAIGETFESAHPSEPCYYLSLLGTRADHRGKGLGMSLLRENLARIDALGAPAYLESSNPANNPRYESVGFEPRDQLTMPAGQRVTTMWRPAR